jgi:hypothetical protein
LGEKEAEEKE